MYVCLFCGATAHQPVKGQCFAPGFDHEWLEARDEEILVPQKEYSCFICDRKTEDRKTFSEPCSEGFKHRWLEVPVSGESKKYFKCFVCGESSKDLGTLSTAACSPGVTHKCMLVTRPPLFVPIKKLQCGICDRITIDRKTFAEPCIESVKHAWIDVTPLIIPFQEYQCEVCEEKTYTRYYTKDCSGDEHEWVPVPEPEDGVDFTCIGCDQETDFPINFHKKCCTGDHIWVENLKDDEQQNYKCSICEKKTLYPDATPQKCSENKGHQWAPVEESDNDEANSSEQLPVKIDDSDEPEEPAKETENQESSQEEDQPLMRGKENCVDSTDCWFGVSEIFPSKQLYLMDSPKFTNHHLHEKLEQLSGVKVVRVETQAGFIRDPFNPIAVWNSKHDKFEQGILLHADNFERHELLGGTEIAGFSEGGNIMFSPPTDQHPLGALLIGTKRKFPEKNLTNYERAVQPVVIVDSTFGHVNHTDECVGFAGTPDNWKMVLPSSGLALYLLKRLENLRPGFLNEQIIPGSQCLQNQSNPTPIEGSVRETREQGLAADLLSRRKLFISVGQMHLRNSVHLMKELGIGHDKIILVPMLKCPLMPNAVNFLPCNGAVVMPRQHSFRVTVKEAKIVFAQLLEVMQLKVEFFESSDFNNFIKESAVVDFVVDEKMTCLDIAGTFIPPGSGIEFSEEPGKLKSTAWLIAEFNGIPSIDEILPTNKFIKIPCPENTFDLFEAYVLLQFASHRIPVHFMPSAHLNRGLGNLHCATNSCANFDKFVEFQKCDLKELKIKMFSEKANTAEGILSRYNAFNKTTNEDADEISEADSIEDSNEDSTED